MGRLFWKFFLFFLLAQLTTLVAVNLVFWMHNRQEAIDSAGIEMSRPAGSVIEAASATLQFGGIQGLKQLLEAWQQRPMPQVFVVNGHGQELLNRPYAPEILMTAEKLLQSDRDNAHVKRMQSKDGQTYLIFVPDDGRGGRFFQLPPPDDQHPPSMIPPPHDHAHPESMGPPRHFSRFPLAPLIGGSIVSMFFAWILAWYFSKPIKHLGQAFTRAADGNLTTRISALMGNRNDELADLGRGFDIMAARLDSLIQGQRRLLHHVSHELRSPLARIQIAIGLAKQSEDKIPTSLDRIQLESERMDGLIGELLQLSKLESGITSLNKEKVDLSGLLTNIAADAQYEAEEHNITVQSEIQDLVIVEGEAELLYRAVENVVRNAIKYSHPLGLVTVALSKNTDQKMAVIKISDQGLGVPENELEAIFQPFMRSSQAQVKDGYGVGLAIAKQIIEAHAGKIYAKNQQRGGGLQVEITLPYFDKVATKSFV